MNQELKIIEIRNPEDDKATAQKAIDDAEAARLKAVKDAGQAKIDADLRAQKAAQQAELDKQKAIDEERTKVIAKEKADADAAKAREADTKHHAKINNEALLGLQILGVDNATAKTIITAIANGKISHVSIKY